MKRLSGLSQRGAQSGKSETSIVRSTRKAGDPLSLEALEQVRKLRSMSDESIDFSDIPSAATGPWQRASERMAVASRAGEPQFLVRRQLTLVEGEVRKSVDVEIGPLRTYASDASCHVRIAGPDQEMNYEIFGVDGVQAVQLALRFSGSELDRLGGDQWGFSKEHGHGFDRISSLQTAS